MGTNPQDGAGPEYIPTQGRATANQEADKETGVWDLGVPIIGGSNDAAGFEGIVTYMTRR